MKSIVYLLFLSLSLSSCHTVRRASADPLLQLIHKSNFSLLKGAWSNTPADDQLNKRYASTFDVNALQDVQLAKQFSLLEENTIADADRVQLLPVNNQLQVTVFRRNGIIAKFSVKGKFKKGYFKTKKQSKTAFPPIPPFYYFNDNVRLYITVDKDNNLVIKRRGKKTGMIFFFASGFSMDNEYRYTPYTNAILDQRAVEATNAGFPDREIQSIDKKVKKINADSTLYSRSSQELDIGGEGGKATFYSKEDTVVLVEKTEYGETFRTEKSYYFDDISGELIYMEERQYRYNRPIYYDAKTARENNDTEAFDERRSVVTTYFHYFEKGRLFYRSNENGKPEDKTQWERLGKELISELSVIYQQN